MDVVALESQSILHGMLALLRTAGRDKIDQWVGQAWEAAGSGRLTEADLGTILDAADKRRETIKGFVEVRHGKNRLSPIGGAAAALVRDLPHPVDPPASNPKVEVSPEILEARAKRLERRHYISICLPMPAVIARNFRVGGRAVLARIALAHRGQGFCELAVQTLAEAAEVCERTVQYTLSLGRKLGLIKVEPGTNGKNRVTVTDPVWLDWLAGHRLTENQENGPEIQDVSDLSSNSTLYDSSSFLGLPSGGAKTCRESSPNSDEPLQEAVEAHEPGPGTQAPEKVSRPSTARSAPPVAKREIVTSVEPETEPNGLGAALSRLMAAVCRSEPPKGQST